MHRLTAAIVSVVIATAMPASAQDDTNEKTDALFEALGMPQLLEVMRAEGVKYGASIAQDMFPNGAGPRWTNLVSDIYDADTMGEEVRNALAAELEGDDIDAMLAFFTSEPGESIVQLEVSARRALLDDAVDEASKERAAIAMAQETPRYLLVRKFVEANDLVETNVVGALNSNYAFYMGLMDGGAMPDGLTADMALQEVWAQEDEIRGNTTEWVYAFLMMAYAPMSDDELEAYIAFSESDAGQDLNSALFGAFNEMFDDISRDLGLASSRFIISQEL